MRRATISVLVVQSRASCGARSSLCFRPCVCPASPNRACPSGSKAKAREACLSASSTDAVHGSFVDLLEASHLRCMGLIDLFAALLKPLPQRFRIIRRLPWHKVGTSCLWRDGREGSPPERRRRLKAPLDHSPGRVLPIVRVPLLRRPDLRSPDPPGISSWSTVLQHRVELGTKIRTSPKRHAEDADGNEEDSEHPRSCLYRRTLHLRLKS